MVAQTQFEMIFVSIPDPAAGRKIAQGHSLRLRHLDLDT